MNRTWWRTPDELDVDQRTFINLPVDGKYLLVGPPGSGKTNLLLLRMQYLAGRGDKNVLFITFTKQLADFIRGGIGNSGLIGPDQIRTYHSWGYSHVLQYGVRNDLPGGKDFNTVREELLAAVEKAKAGLPSTRIYDAIFVDEVQDLTIDELRALLGLSDRVCVCGDGNQGIYGRNGLDIANVLGLETHCLRSHYRIGQRIARVADRLIRPEPGAASLEGTCNYNVATHGASSAAMNVAEDRNDQFRQMLEIIRVELDAFPDEQIGVLCGKNSTLDELRTMFDTTELREKVSVHGVDEGASFGDEKPIHVLTIHSSKGAEFRAVHLFGAEELAAFPLNRTRLSYTGVTRAKTALNVYRSGPTSAALESALAEETDFDWRTLLPGDDDE